MYKYMLQRNQCNHRDYQNIAVNGARSDAILKLSQSLSRNSTDHPLLFILELVGNDICTPHHTLDRMTTPPEFYNNIVAFLKDLDTRIPPGSHVPIFGVVDGRLLWNVLWNRTHPIGQPYYRVYVAFRFQHKSGTNANNRGFLRLTFLRVSVAMTS
jgi:acyloxyacyl hydrolase